MTTSTPTLDGRARARPLAVVTTLLIGLQVAGAAPVGAVTDAPVVAGPGGTVAAHAGPSASQPVVAEVPSRAKVSIQFGHVAYVVAVNHNDTVDVENGVTDHNFNQRTVPTSSFNYIDLDG